MTAIRVPTLVLALAGGAASASGSIVVLFNLNPAVSTGALVVAGLGTGSLLLAQAIHIFDPTSGTLDPGTARILTVVNTALGTVIATSNGVIGLLPHEADGFGHLVLAILGAAQLAAAAGLHSADAQVNAPVAKPG